jgi:predicted N-acetyltransferase YhbS
MWVDPIEMRKGIGRALVHRICEEASDRGVTLLRIVSDPHAVGFYERMGAVRVGESDSRPAGRRIPVLEMQVRDGTQPS